jgi:hypothetical protein
MMDTKPILSHFGKLNANHAISTGKINRFDYALHGDQTFVDELYKKVLRLKSLTDSKLSPNNESIEDSLIDIVNYSGDFYAYREYKKLKMKNQKKLPVKVE